MDIAWKPHPGPQQDFCSRWEFEVLFGGAAGPGKTDCVIMEALRYVGFADYKGLILRRTFPQLQEIIDRTREKYPLVGGDYRAGEHRWYFPSGASIKLGHMQHGGDEYNYQGQEYQYIAFDEACQFLPTQYLYLFSRCRSTNPAIIPKIRAATNPGGVGHQFFKDRFRIGTVEPQTTIYDNRTNMARIFIPGRLKDNPTLMENDPEYINRLYQLPELERMRLMDGLWDAFEGQKFSELNKDIHGFDGELPFEWECFGAFDWGYARPWTYGVWRVDYDGRIYLDSLHYGARENFINVGMRQTDTEIARIIREIEKPYRRVSFRVAGHDIFNPKRRKDGVLGPAPAEEMAREGIVFIKADDNRIIGWQQIHHRLKVDEEGRPWVYARRSLDHFWRTMGLMQEDPKNPEDISTKDIEDHVPEMVRYACMSRPIRPRITVPEDLGSFRAERRKYIKAKQYAVRHGTDMATAYRKT